MRFHFERKLNHNYFIIQNNLANIEIFCFFAKKQCQICINEKKNVILRAKFHLSNHLIIINMADNPSYNGIVSSSKTVLRTIRKEPETSVSTVKPTPSSNGIRPHA